MPCLLPTLLDTNQLLRIAQPQAPEYPVVTTAIIKYLKGGERPAICPQNIYEFWSVSTRPAGPPSNGLGLTALEAEAEIEAFEDFFQVLTDVPAIYNEWRVLMKTWKVTGRQSFDARLIATMIVHKVPQLMTFDVNHFRRYEKRGIVIDGQPLRIIHPADA